MAGGFGYASITHFKSAYCGTSHYYRAGLGFTAVVLTRKWERSRLANRALHSLLNHHPHCEHEHPPMPVKLPHRHSNAHVAETRVTQR